MSTIRSRPDRPIRNPVVFNMGASSIAYHTPAGHGGPTRLDRSGALTDARLDARADGSFAGYQ